LSAELVLLLLEDDVLERGYAQSKKKLTTGPAQTFMQLPSLGRVQRVRIQTFA